jgi:hypothetical protein
MGSNVSKELPNAKPSCWVLSQRPLCRPKERGEGNEALYAFHGLYAQTPENSVKVDFRLPQSGAALVC